MKKIGSLPYLVGTFLKKTYIIVCNKLLSSGFKNLIEIYRPLS